MKVTDIKLTPSPTLPGYSSVLAFTKDLSMEPVTLQLAEVDGAAPYVLKGATGLEAPELGDQLGSRQNYANFGALEPREISLLMQINPDYKTDKTISDLRDDIYRMANTAGNGLIDVGFWNGDEAVAHIHGYVTKVDTNVFVKESEVLIMIRCPDPMIRAYLEENCFDMDESELYEPPPPSVTNDSILILNDTKSTAPHGFVMELEFNGNPYPAPFEIITHHANLGQSYFRIGEAGTGILFLGDDKLRLNTNPMQLQIDVYNEFELDPPNYSRPLAHKLAPGFRWPTIYPGYNVFEFNPPLRTAPLSTYVIKKFTHYPTYWGI